MAKRNSGNDEYISPREVMMMLGVSGEHFLPWEEAGYTTSRLMAELRKNAGWSQKELAKLLYSTDGTVGNMESSCNRRDVEILLLALTPRLKEQVAQGWLDPQTLYKVEERYEQLARACQALREKAGLTPPQLNIKIKSMGLGAFSATAFEHASRGASGAPNTLAGLMIVAHQLGTVFNKTPKELFKIGQDYVPGVTTGCHAPRAAREPNDNFFGRQ